MKNLNPSIYSSLRNYQETYEFYRCRKEIPSLLQFRLVQGALNVDINKQSKAA